MPLTPNDSPEIHVRDTLSVGRYLDDTERVWFTVSKASEVYEFLRGLGINFESVELGGVHSIPRTFSIKGLTGKYIMDKLYVQAKERYVNFVRSRVSSLTISDNTCIGFINEKGEHHHYDAVIIASGSRNVCEGGLR